MSPETSIAHYRVTGKLGEGGMGAVYRATDTKLHRDVAIKVLPEAVAGDPDRLARFEREAQVLASLNHPNIASIYGVEDRALVMELVEGELLQGPLPPAQALPIVHQLIDALEYAHEKGVIHRDLKPANIKIMPEGRVKVLDFGLAKAMSAESALNDPRSSPTLTMRATVAGTIMGTAAYMAPEQARGHAVDRRADIWAFAVVVYELLTGRLLFDAPTISDTLAAVLMREPDLSTVPEPFHRLLRLCLVQDPRKRLRDISGARVALDLPVQPAAPAPLRRGNYLWIGVAALFAAIAAAAWLRPSPAPDRPLVRLPIDLGPESASSAITAQISPDGQRIAYGIRSERGFELAIRLLSEKQAKPLSPFGNLYSSFSPDGEWLAIYNEGKLRKISVHGGAPIVLADASVFRGASWFDDGSLVASLDGRTLVRIPQAGGPPQTILAPSKPEGVYRWPQVLPGGEAILFTSHTSDASDYEGANIEFFSLNSGQSHVVQRGGYYGRYLPSGHLVFINRGTMFAIPFNPSTGEIRGAPVPVLDDVAANTAWGAGHFSFSQNGTLIYASGKYDVVRPFAWMEPSAPPTSLGLPPGANPKLSPDGNRLAMVVNDDLVVYDVATGVPTRITFDRQRPRAPVWAPDGRHLAFTTQRGAEWARADGSGPSRVMLAGSPIAGSFAPDGRMAYHQNGGSTFRDIWTVKLDLTNPDEPRPGTPEVFLASPGVDVDPTYSADGRWIAYSSNLGADYQVFVRPASGSGVWQVSSDPARFPVWSRKSNQLFFQSLNSSIMVVDYSVNNGVFSPGNPKTWIHTPVWLTGNLPNFDISADGKRAIAAPAPLNAEAGAFIVLLNFFDELKRKVK